MSAVRPLKTKRLVLREVRAEDWVDARLLDSDPEVVRYQTNDVLDEASMARLADLPKDMPLAFLCHHGNRSRQAAEHFRGLGFHDLYNVEGGIAAWSEQVDPTVPRY